MRTALICSIALALLLPAAGASAQIGRFCDSTWCMDLDKSQRIELGSQLIRAVATLKLPFRDPLKPIQVQPKGMPWRAAKLRKVPRKFRARATPKMAAPFDSGGFPYPFEFRGTFKLPGKKGTLGIVVRLSPVAAGVPDPPKDQFCELRDDRDDYMAWEQAWITGKARKRPNIQIEYNLVVGSRRLGVQGVPNVGPKPDKLAPLRSIHIKLSGQRRVVDGIAKRIDIKALKALVSDKTP